jgi:hypothetical protein
LKLTDRTLEELAKMVVGDAKYFPYRSSYFISKFFSRCGLPFTHDGTTRPIWAQDRLAELNLGACQSVDLPSDDLCRVVSELFDAEILSGTTRRLAIAGKPTPIILPICRRPWPPSISWSSVKA